MVCTLRRKSTYTRTRTTTTATATATIWFVLDRPKLGPALSAREANDALEPSCWQAFSPLSRTKLPLSHLYPGASENWYEYGQVVLVVVSHGRVFGIPVPTSWYDCVFLKSHAPSYE